MAALANAFLPVTLSSTVMSRTYDPGSTGNSSISSPITPGCAMAFEILLVQLSWSSPSPVESDTFTVTA